MFESAARHEQETLRAELRQAVSEKDQQLQVLKNSCRSCRAASRLRPPRPPKRRRSLTPHPRQPLRPAPKFETLRKLVAQLEAERQASQQRLDAVPRHA